MFEAATTAFVPKTGATSKKDDEIASLKAQLADLQSKVDKLGS
jgi:hypothetical protein